MLLERPSGIVSREEMRQRLWGSETFVDFDHGLNTAINRLREALGDSASTPRFVETVAGKGYRFLAPVTIQNDSLALVEPEPSEITSVARVFATAKIARPPDSKEGLAARLATERILTTSQELPSAPMKLVRNLLLLLQIMYLGFYLGALANLGEIHDIFFEFSVPAPALLMPLLITSSAVLIPVRLYLFLAVALDFRDLTSKFHKLFPILLIADLLWSVSPFLLVHHINTGVALGLCTPLVYVPFAQRSLILMYSRGRQP